jgi:sulfur carrier protein ThiS
MKATIEFNLPEDDNQYKWATNGYNYFAVLYNFKAYLRNKLKHEDLSDDRIFVIEQIQSDFLEMLYDEEVIL